MLNTVPRQGLEILWGAFNDTANGFGLTEEIFVQIVVELHVLVGLSKPQLATRASRLYKLYDTDQVRRIQRVWQGGMTSRVSIRYNTSMCVCVCLFWFAGCHWYRTT